MKLQVLQVWRTANGQLLAEPTERPPCGVVCSRPQIGQLATPEGYIVAMCARCGVQLAKPRGYDRLPAVCVVCWSRIVSVASFEGVIPMEPSEEERALQARIRQAGKSAPRPVFIMAGASITLEEEGANLRIAGGELVTMTAGDLKEMSGSPGLAKLQGQAETFHVFSIAMPELLELRDWLALHLPAAAP